MRDSDEIESEIEIDFSCKLQIEKEFGLGRGGLLQGSLGQ